MNMSMGTKIFMFKLKSGMDIIGKSSVNEDGTYAVRQPFMVQAMATPNGVAVSLIPFLLFASPAEVEKGITIDSTDTFKVYSPDSRLESAYLEQSSGIALAVGNNPLSAMKI